jgi:predicted AlkP superfamily phosphohydrolase/phosphomutase
MAKLIATGAHGVLQSTIPPMSAQAWTTAVTGVNLARHAVVDFAARVPGTYGLKFLNGGSRATPAVWDYLGDAGRRVQVVNVPMTYPPRAVNGVLVAGMDAPSVRASFVFPGELRDTLLDEFPHYRIEPAPYKAIHGRGGYAAVAREALETEETRFAAVRLLEETFRPHFSMAVFRSADIVQHWFWHCIDPEHPRHRSVDCGSENPVLDAYQQLDRFVGSYLERMSGDDVLIVLSDHGFGPLGTRLVRLNTWLREQGMLVPSDGVTGGLWPRLQWRLWTAARRRLPRAFRSLLLSRFPAARARAPTEAAFSGIDWTRTQAFALETRGAIYINVKGREPLGTVEPGQDYERVREEIIARLEALRDPLSGDRVVRRVARREQLYSGAFMEWVPDLLVEWADGPQPHLGYSALSRNPEPVEIWSRRDLGKQRLQSGAHITDGVVMLAGRPIRGGALQPSSLADVAPTALYFAGVAVPRGLDGNVLEAAVDPDHLTDNPVRYAQPLAGVPEGEGADGYAGTEVADIEARLRGLRYID